MLAILQFVISQKQNADFSSFQLMNFGQVGIVIQIITTKALNPLKNKNRPFCLLPNGTGGDYCT